MSSNSESRRSFLLSFATAWLALSLVLPLQAAAPHYLQAGQPDPISLLPPPPLAGSAEQAADLASVIAVHRESSAVDTAMAKSEKKFFICGEFCQGAQGTHSARTAANRSPRVLMRSCAKPNRSRMPS